MEKGFILCAQGYSEVHVNDPANKGKKNFHQHRNTKDFLLLEDFSLLYHTQKITISPVKDTQRVSYPFFFLMFLSRFAFTRSSTNIDGLALFAEIKTAEKLFLLPCHIMFCCNLIFYDFSLEEKFLLHFVILSTRFVYFGMSRLLSYKQFANVLLIVNTKHETISLKCKLKAIIHNIKLIAF